MKKLLLVSLFIFSSASSANAVIRTVKTSGGDFTTIQACANAMAAGDTCSVFVGTYNEVVTTGAGTVGNYKTFTVNPGDTVNVFAFIPSSHVKVNGFVITRPGSPNTNACIAFNQNVIDLFVTNNTMTSCGDSRAIIDECNGGCVASSGIDQIYYQGNTLSYPCSTPGAPNVCEGFYINGDHHLIENNDISHVSDAVTNFGQFNIYRKNTVHNIQTSDCAGLSSNCHIDFIESEPSTSVSRPTIHNLYEANIINGMLATGSPGGSGTHAFLTQADTCASQCVGVIIRFNNMAHVGTYGLINDNNHTTAVPGFTFVKSYNNNWIDFNVAGQGVTTAWNFGSTGGSEINSLYYYIGSPNSGTMNPYNVDGTSGTGFTAASNLAFCTGSCTFTGRNGSGSWTADATGNIVANPNFINYGSNNFHLTVGSSAIGGGASLTKAVGAGASSTSLTVTDAAFFQDGYGITGVQADWIRVGSLITSPIAQISSVNYSTNVITLASAISWSNNDPVFLYKDSSGVQVLFAALPDIGALQFGVPAVIPPAPAIAIFAYIPVVVLPLPVVAVPPVLTKITPAKSYVTNKGFSQDGVTWSPLWGLSVTGSGFSTTNPTCTFDTIKVSCSCTPTQCNLSLSLSLVSLPTVGPVTHNVGIGVPSQTIPTVN